MNQQKKQRSEQKKSKGKSTNLAAENMLQGNPFAF